MRNRFKIFVIIILILPHLNKISAQNFEHNNQSSIVIDKKNRVITTSQTRLKLFLATDSLGNNSAEIKQRDNREESLELLNQGKHNIIITAPGRRKIGDYQFFVDNEPPRSAFTSEKNYLLYSDTIAAASGFELKIVSTDNIAGVLDVYVKIDEDDYSIASDKYVFDIEKHYNFCFFAVDIVGNKEDEKCYIINIDDSAPVTKLEITKNQHKNIVSPRSRFKLIAEDNHGVKETWYRINDKDPALYNSPVPINRLNEGYHTFYYYSIDKLGNIEEKNEYKFYLDKTPPIIFEEIIGNSFIHDGREYSSGRSQLRLTAIDNKAGIKAIYYSINGQDYQKYEGPVFLSMISGDINIRFYALDNVNNKSQSSVKGTSTAIPYVDLNAPEISHTIRQPKIFLRDTLFISPTTQISLYAVDHESGLNRIIYNISNHPESEYSKPFNIEKQGFYNIQYTAFDNVDNANTDNFSVFVNTEGPDIEIIYSIKSYDNYIFEGETFPVFPKHLQIFLAATDIHTGVNSISYSLNGRRIQQYRGPVSGFNKNQINTIEIIATDILGNESIKEVQFYIN